MDECEVVRMRDTVRDYYDQFLDPKAFAEELSRSDCRRAWSAPQKLNQKL